MASVKTKQAPANGAGKKTKASAPSTGTSTPVTASTTLTSLEPVVYGSGRPDKSLYDAEQNKIKAEIDATQAKLNAVKDKLANAGRGGPAQERRKVLLAELAEIRSAQGNIKQTRSKIFDQVKGIQEGVQKKIKDLNAAKAKVPFKSVADVDDRIKQLEKQIESGTMKVADEKRALADINTFKRNRRIVEGFQNEENAIAADRAAAAELKKQLDDPEGQAISARYDAIQAELDELKKQVDEAHEARGKLLDERTELQGQLDVLYNLKRESGQRYRDANDKFFAKVSEDRARRAERERAQREADEQAKKKEIVDRLREEAEAPAFQVQIEDCQTLIDSFSGKSSNVQNLSTEPAKEKAGLTGVPQLDIRKVEAGPSDGLVVRKKKGEDEDAYFVGKKKGKKQTAKAAPAASTNGSDAPGSSDRLNIPLGTLTALLNLSIPPPASSSDIPRVIEDLKTKQAWFVANQARVTAENKAKAEEQIKRLTGKNAKTDSPATDDLTPPNGGGELPSEPAPTPAVDDAPHSLPVPDGEVEEKLHSVEESEEAVEAEP